MNRRVALVALATVVVLSLLAPLAAAGAGSASMAAQTTTNNTTDTAETGWEAPGPFGLSELQTGGTKMSSTGDADPPKSARSLGTGGILVRHRPPSLLESSYERVESGTVVNSNVLSVKTQAYLDAAGEYEMVLVYWQKETKRVNGTSVTYAADQTVQRVSFTADSGYDASKIKLRPHYDETVRVTAWLERDGERVDGARWLFKHRSNPLSASPAFSINDKSDQWRWAGMFALLPGITALLASGKIARHFLDRTIVGAQKGIGFWGFTVGLIVLAAGGAATFATATVLANAPVVAGLSMGLIGFVIMLGINDTEVQRAGFFQRRLDEDAVTPTGDSAASSRVVPNRIKNIVERGSTLYAPADGVFPMLARYWADPASVPRSELQTVDEGDDDSALAKMYEVDPTSDKVLKHTPAHLTFSPSLTVDVDEDELSEPPERDGIAALPAAVEASASNLVKKLNWRFLLGALGGGALLYFGAMQFFGSQLVAYGLASAPALIQGTKAVDGELALEPAPYHYNDVRATVATERQEYVSRKTFEDLHKQIQEIDWQALDRAQDTVQALRQEMSDKMDQMFGTTTGDMSGDGGSDDDDLPPWATSDDGQKGVGDD